MENAQKTSEEITSSDWKLLRLNFSGPDRPGIISELTQILASYDVLVLDVGQAVIHRHFTLGFLIHCSEEKSSSLIKDLLFRAYNLGLQVTFTPIEVQEYNEWRAEEGKGRYLITMLGRQINANQISQVTAVVSSYRLNVDIVNRLSGRQSLVKTEQSRNVCVQLSIRGDVENLTEMKRKFFIISQETGIDIAVQEENLFYRNRRMVVFDMDSTLIQAEVIDELAKLHGVGEQVEEITKQAMRGEIDFRASFTQRLSLLAGLSVSILQQVANNLPLTEGMERLIKILKLLGYKTAILSGGFQYFGDYLKAKFGFDYVYCNQLDIENGVVTGKVKGEIVTGEYKAQLLRQIAAKENISLEQTIAVGDGANDIPMLSIAGLGVAFHAKPIVKERAKHSISSVGLDGLLYLMGISDTEINKHIKI